MSRKVIVVGLIALVSVTAFFISFKRAAPPKVIPTSAAVVDNARLFYDAACKMREQGDYYGAVKNFGRAAAEHPDSDLAKASLYALASLHEKRGELVKAKEVYRTLLERFPDPETAAKVQSALGRTAIAAILAPYPDTDSFSYEVKPGDTLTGIARKFNTTVDLIMKSNSLRDATIRTGQNLKVTKLAFSVIVDKSQNILTLKGGDRVLKTYSVATGINNSTPTGAFKIISKVVDPVWYTQDAVVPAGSPKNILGSRWMGISKPHYGIHGSTDPSSIGKQATAGCVRMNNADVEELYMLVPLGTGVTIED